MPLSQLHYHFGSKQGLILALLEEENQRRLERQTRMYARGRAAVAALRAGLRLPGGRPRLRLRAGAAGDDRRRLVEPDIGDAVRRAVGRLVRRCSPTSPGRPSDRHGPLGPFTADEAATLIVAAFIGSEALLLLGFDRRLLPIRSALRRIGVLIRQLEEGSASPRRTDDARLPTDQ